MTPRGETLDHKDLSLAPLLDPYRDRIEGAIKAALQKAGKLPIYGMLRYFMGYETEDFRLRELPAGKRIRPALFLYVNDALGGSSTQLDFAVAIELFHNFTLIHDDVEDHDEFRRGRPTVWKIWGTNHAINAGDAQALLSTQYLTKAASTDPGNGGKAAAYLHEKFLQVAEGQYLDFELSRKQLDDVSVTKEAYLEMVRKKTSVLVGGATAAGGIAAGCTQEVAKDLYDFGESLGMAYQIADDMASLWADSGATGKNAYGDIRERKKTLPVLFAHENHAGRKRLTELYAQSHNLGEREIEEVIFIVDASKAYEQSRDIAISYIKKATDSLKRLPIAENYKEALRGIVRAFVQFPKANA